MAIENVYMTLNPDLNLNLNLNLNPYTYPYTYNYGISGGTRMGYKSQETRQRN